MLQCKEDVKRREHVYAVPVPSGAYQATCAIPIASLGCQSVNVSGIRTLVMTTQAYHVGTYRHRRVR